MKKSIFKIGSVLVFLIFPWYLITHVKADNVDSPHHVGRYHLTTKDGWSNDLQSIVWNEKGHYYDIYFLHSETADDPDEAGHQNWYHTTTKDFVHFTKQNEALVADGPETLHAWRSAWTGTVLVNNGMIKGVPKGAYVAYFSGLKKSDGTQNIWATWSDDNGKTFTHVLNNATPVIDHSWDFTSKNKVDERDPAVVYWNNRLLMYVAEGNEIGVYRSIDGINWVKADENGRSKVMPSTYMNGINTEGHEPVECPVLRSVKTTDGKIKQVLFYGAKAPKEGQTTGTYYVVGHLNPNGLFVAETKSKRLDQGSDYYGANFTGSSDLGQPTTDLKTMGWIGNWSYVANGVHNDQEANSEFTKHLGSYSLARKLYLTPDLQIKQTPIYGYLNNVKHYLNVSKDMPVNVQSESYTRGKDTNGGVYNLYDIPDLDMNKLYRLRFFNTRENYQGRVYIDIWQGKDHVSINYDPSNGDYLVNSYAGELDNGRNGQVASSAYFDGMLGNGKGYLNNSGVKNVSRFELKVFTDRNSVEVFFPNGQAYTVARFSTSDKQDLKIYTEDPTNGNRVDILQGDLN